MAKKKPKKKHQQPKSKQSSAFYRPFEGLATKPVDNDTPTSGSKRSHDTNDTAAPAPRPATENRPSTTRSSSEDMLTFERLMGGVTPMEHKRGVRVIPTAVTATNTKTAKQRAAKAWEEEQKLERQARASLRALVQEGASFEIRQSSRYVQGRRRGIDGRRFKLLTEGRLPMDATVDLREHPSTRAKQVLTSFIASSRAHGHRAVLLMMGDPRHGSPETVLRGELVAWLSEGEASVHVDAFCTAPADLGGEHAMCVLLK